MQNACDFSLAENSRNLFETHHASQIFQLVLDNWNLYSPWIELNEVHRHCRKCLRSRENILEDIGESPSHAEHGPNTKILDTVLPDIDPFMLKAGVPLAVANVLNSGDTAVRYRLQLPGYHHTQRLCILSEMLAGFEKAAQSACSMCFLRVSTNPNALRGRQGSN